MKIAFPTRDNRKITRHFGKMNNLIIVEVIYGVETSRETRDMSDMPACSNCGTGKLTYVTDKLTGSDVLIAQGIGEGMARHAEAEGIKIVLTTVKVIEDALDKFIAGNLTHHPELAH